jgi:protein-L-isoaspartate(D-aspartate) O-methyltransferase
MTSQRARDRLIAKLREEGIRDPRVLDAIRAVPRGAFMPEAAASAAWANRPAPIGHGQTISQPFIVALMTDLLDLAPGARVLEIGTGSGYQAAVLAALGCAVFSVEIIPALADAARRALDGAGFGSVRTRLGDGAEGWPDHAPYDAVIVTAAARSVPPALIAQLGPGGRMVLPVGEPDGEQTLVLVRKDDAGAVTETPVLAVAFVPLTGAGGSRFPARDDLL